MDRLDEDIEGFGGLGLTFRSFGRLRYAGVETIGQLVAMTEQDLLDVPRLGPRILADIKRALAEEGLELNREA